MERDTCTIATWDGFKKELNKQFYPEDVAYQARRNMKNLMHTKSIREYVHEFSTLMLEIPNMTDEESSVNFFILFYFILNLCSSWILFDRSQREHSKNIFFC
ncbi:hypothetical protein CsSME_00028795 [Camellia sinensis var. sinensis]